MTLFKQQKKGPGGKGVKRAQKGKYFAQKMKDQGGEQYESMVTPRSDQIQNMERVEVGRDGEWAGQEL